jgi:hypothetical protein
MLKNHENAVREFRMFGGVRYSHRSKHALKRARKSLNHIEFFNGFKRL